jgi:hypothetical protein
MTATNHRKHERSGRVSADSLACVLARLLAYISFHMWPSPVSWSRLLCVVGRARGAVDPLTIDGH